MVNYFLVSFDYMDETIYSNDDKNDVSGEFGNRGPGHGHSKLHPQVLIKR